MGFSSLRTSWAFRLLGLLGLFVCWDFLGFSPVRTSRVVFCLSGFLTIFAKQIIPAGEPNGRFATSLDSHLFGLLGFTHRGFSSVRTSWAFRLLGLLGFFVC